jgi:hypothetical protein
MPPKGKHEPHNVTPPKAFVVWAQRNEDWEDSQEERWRQEVLAFALLLRYMHIDADLDLFHLHEGLDWSRFGETRINETEHILVVLSQAWRERYDGQNVPTIGAGAAREARALRGIFDKNQEEFSHRVKLVSLPSVSGADLIPLGLTGVSHFKVEELTVRALEPLRCALTGNPRFPKPPLGTPPGPLNLLGISEIALRGALGRLSSQPGDAPETDALIHELSERLSTFDARRARRRRRIAWAAGTAGASALLVSTGVIGWRIGNRESDDHSAATADLQIRTPSDWTRTSYPPLPGIVLSRSVAVAPRTQNGVGIVAGISAATGPTLLSRSLLARIDQGRLHGERVQLGHLQGYRYRRLRPDHGQLAFTVFVVPTTAGVVTVACYSTPADAASFTGTCERVAHTLTLTRGRQSSLGPSEEYADRVDTALRHLSNPWLNARVKLRSARTQEERATAASKLEKAFQAATAVLRKQDVSPFDSAAHGRIVMALERVSNAYLRMAAAARTEDRTEFNRAVGQVRASETELRRTLDALRSLGYPVA